VLAANKLAQWSADGVAIPAHAVERWKARGLLPADIVFARTPTPRVVGLVFDDDRKTALVNPLVTTCSSELKHSAFVPFTAQAIQSLLIRVCEELAPQIPGMLPERFGFDFKESMQERCDGNSLDVAALLSALDALTEQSNSLFAGACALVGTGPNDPLTGVRYVREKLDAFLREYERGSLLVISPASEVDDQFRSAFDAVWVVGSIAELAEKIRGLPTVVSKLVQTIPVTPRQIGLVVGRLRHLDEIRDDNRVVRLCERIENCGFSDNVVFYDRIRVLSHHADSLRHLGRHRDSLAVETRIEASLDNCDDVISRDELLGHTVRRAAALFDCCDFTGTLSQLEPWLTACNKDPQQFTGQKRVELFNTAGRAMVMLGIAGWEPLFQRSTAIQAQIDRASIRRTEGYLIEGYTRTNHLADADTLISKHEQAASPRCLDDGFTRFYRCDLERRRGSLSPDQSSELLASDDYTGAFAQQAAARQRGRDVEQATRLLERAEQILIGLSKDDQNILRLIAGALTLTRAGISGDRALWRESRNWIRKHVRDLGEAQRAYFGNAVDSLGDEPGRDAAEQLLGLLPYI
jgi:hypothetical protein